MIRRIIVSSVMCVLLAVPTFFLRGPFGYFPVLFFVAAAGLSFCYIWLLKRSFSFLQPTEVRQCERGKEEQFTACVKGNGFLLFPRVTSRFYANNLFGQVSQTTEVDIVLAPGVQKTFGFNISFDHLGTYETGISSVRIYDLFGLFYLPQKNPGESRIMVKPRALDVTCFDFTEEAGRQVNRTASKSKIESNDYSGIRQYVPGDAIKNIHWKLSAHAHDYMVRQFESYTSRGYTVYLDLETTGYTPDILPDLYDCLVETAYSVAAHVLQKQEDLELIYSKEGLPKLALPKSRDSLDATVTDLGGISISNNGQLIDLLETSVSRQYGLDILVICTANLSEPLVQILSAAKEQRKAVFLFYAVSTEHKHDLSTEEHGLLDALLEIGIETCVLDKADEIQKTEVEAYA